MVTSVNKEDGEYLFKSLEAGAFDYVEKPSLSEVKEAGVTIIKKIKTAAMSNTKLGYDKKAGFHLCKDRLDLSMIISIGASTGGDSSSKRPAHSYAK
jgi:chemotaxis response regulator CheB